VVDCFLRIDPPTWSEVRNRTLADGGRKTTNLPPLVLHECRLNNS
jgi:hypothetical protein